MNCKAGKLLTIAIVVAEIASAGAAATAASAQSAKQTQRQIIKQQQQMILQQQRQIQENQRRIESQQAQLNAPVAPAVGSPAPRNLDRGILGNIGNCPVGWTYSLFNGCLPTVVVIH